MKIPEKIRAAIISEAQKHARFSWYQGWERSSGYIRSDLRGDCRFGSCRIYIKWEKKKPPTEDQIAARVVEEIDALLSNKNHHQDQRDFTHYLLETYYIDMNKVKHQTMLEVIDGSAILCKALAAYEHFSDEKAQDLYKALVKLEQGVADHEAITQFLEQGRERMGES